MIDSAIAAKIYGWRVRTGLIGAIASLYFARVSISSLFIGLAVALCGLAIRAWACGHLIKEKELTTSGPYRWTRNPLYFGNIIIGTAIVISSNSWWTLGIFAAYFLIFYPIIILVERDRLRELFAEQYKEYSRKVPLVFPSFRPKHEENQRKFDWRLFRKNKELRAITSILIFWSFFALKMFVFP